MSRLRTLTALTLTCGALLPALPATAADRSTDRTASYSWVDRGTGSAEQYRGLAAVDKRVAWVSGEKGSVLRTSDGGRTWKDVSPPAARAEGLALRDIEARDGRTALALAIGPGEQSRIFRTSDGGATWTETFRNTDERAFYDCMAMTPQGVGLAMSDPVDGRFLIQRTTDGGRTWNQLPPEGMPPALEGEFGFAASGTCLVTAQQSTGHGRGEFWMVTGGATPRIFHTSNAGDTWSVRTTPLRGGEAAGIYSVAFKNSRDGVMVGGDYTAPADATDAAAWTANGGQSWTTSTSPVGGYRSGVAFDLRTSRNVIAVGPSGSDLSVDGGRTWTAFGATAYDGVQCTRDGACWASGPKGAVAVLNRR